MTARFAPQRVFRLTLLGVMLVQAAWILTVPAFRGSDEFDHVYQAAAVARGQWRAPNPAPHGRGGIVTIPGDIVHAATRVCEFYKYTEHDNCHPIRSVGHGEVEVATAAGAYNPAYYLVTGTLARPFTGAGAAYAMRVITAIACALLMAWAAALTARWATTAWPLVTLTVGFTPVLVYSTAVAAPNGLTYASAALVWASLVALGRTGISQRGLAAPLTLGAVVLVATHTTGTMWLALILLVALVSRPLRHWTGVFVASRRTWLLSAATVLTATALCIAWIRFAHTNSLAGPVLEPDPFPWNELPVYHALWVLQAIGAFPLRNEPAPVPVYVLWGLILATAVFALFRFGSRRERLAAGVTFLLLAIVPTALTVVSYESQSVAWQGRYSLPFWLGITSFAGLALDRRKELRRGHLILLYAMLTVAMTISTVNTGLHEVAHGPADPVAAGWIGGFVLVGLLTIAGSLLPLLLLNTRSPDERVSRPAFERAEVST